MKKSLFCTFMFACFPGAGQMYLEHMKRGLSIMILFFGASGLIALTGMDFLLFVLPIIFCYSFFDTFHIRNASAEELAEMPDKFILNIDDSEYIKKFWNTKHFYIGLVLLILGIYVLLINMNFIPDYIMSEIRRYFPTIVTSLILIFVGYKFMVGGKNEE